MSLSKSNSKFPKATMLIGLAITLTGLTFKLNHLMGAHTIFNIAATIIFIPFTPFNGPLITLTSSPLIK